MSLAFFLGHTRISSFRDFQKHSAQIYVLKNWPQNANILSHFGFVFEVIRSGDKIPGKHTLFYSLFFDLKKLSQDLYKWWTRHAGMDIYLFFAGLSEISVIGDHKHH